MFNKRPVNFQVASQHIDEAAFYWQQRQAGIWSPIMNREDLSRLDHLVKAHLRGIRVAGEPLVAGCLENVNRWRAAEDVFVLCWLWTVTGSSEAKECLQAIVSTDPEFVAAVESAFFWNPETCLPRAMVCFESESDHLRAASVRPLSTFSPHPRQLIGDALNDQSFEVQMKAIRAVCERQQKSFLREVQAFLDYPDATCRVEAAVALLQLAGEKHSQVLVDAVTELLTAREQTCFEPGERQLPMIRRSILSWALASDEPEFANWIDLAIENPALLREAVWAIAFRGDVSYFSQLKHVLQTKQVNGLVMYAASHISGIDFEDSELTIEETDDDQKELEVNDWISEDAGLPTPDQDRFGDWLDDYQANHKPHQRLLAGQPLAEAIAQVLKTGNQPQYWQTKMFKNLRSVDAV